MTTPAHQAMRRMLLGIRLSRTATARGRRMYGVSDAVSITLGAPSSSIVLMAASLRASLSGPGTSHYDFTAFDPGIDSLGQRIRNLPYTARADGHHQVAGPKVCKDFFDDGVF